MTHYQNIEDAVDGFEGSQYDNLSDFDGCECGDYRIQHDEKGRCRMPNDLAHGFEVCREFRLFQRATEIPGAWKQEGTP